MEKIKTAIILCGGKGTRLRPLTYEIPKSLIPVQGKPLIEHLIELFIKFEIENVVLAVGHMKERIKRHFNEKDMGIDLLYVEEDIPLGTAGPLKVAKEKGLIDGTFITTNGDELKDININEMYLIHKKKDSLATLALTEVEDPSHYGVADIFKNRITRFVEKPPKGEEPSKLINAGFYIMEPEIIDIIPEGFAMLEKHVFPRLASEGKLHGFPFNGQWFDTGNMERYEKAIKNWRGLTNFQNKL